MKCPHCKTDLTEDFKNVWKAGYLEGESQLRKTINLVKATNSNLMDELLRLDFEKPVVDDPYHITITFRISILKKFVKILHSKRTTLFQRIHYAQMLQNHIKEHEKRQQLIAENIAKGLKNAENNDS